MLKRGFCLLIWPTLGLQVSVRSPLPLIKTNRLIWLQIDKDVTELSPTNPKTHKFYYLCTVLVLLLLPAFIGDTRFSCGQWNYTDCFCLLSIRARKHAKHSFIRNQFKWLGSWDLFKGRTSERDLCFWTMCRNGSCFGAMGLFRFGRQTLAAWNFWAEIFTGGHPLLNIWLDTHIWHSLDNHTVSMCIYECLSLIRLQYFINPMIAFLPSI